MSIADTTNFGILRLIVNDPDKAEKVLQSNGFTTRTSVIAIGVKDEPEDCSGAEHIKRCRVGNRIHVCLCQQKEDEALLY